ncbi:MAG: HdeA/HdeB family chaperone [Candidatus Baltobacteraceae bacterium]
MIRNTMLAVLTALFFGFSDAGAHAQSTAPMLSTPAQFDLSAFKCHDLLDASLTNRGYAIMLFWGYEAGKAGDTKFVTAGLRSQSQKLTDYCAEHPQMLVFDAIKHVKPK